MIGGEFVITGDGLITLGVVFTMLGFWVGLMTGNAESRDKEREREQLNEEVVSLEQLLQKSEDDCFAAHDRMRQCSTVINMQLQTIKELEAQIDDAPKDQVRYRWVRSQVQPGRERDPRVLPGFSLAITPLPRTDVRRGDVARQFDAAVDAGIAAATKPQQAQSVSPGA